MLKKLCIFITFPLNLATSFTLLAEEPTQPEAQIVSGSWYETDSKVMGERRRYAVYLPPSYRDDQNKRYPVLYVLDGSATKLRGVAGMVEALSSEELSHQIPEFILVAIPNTNRSRDLTPTKTDLMFNGKVLDKLAENSGGADKFAKFIDQELFKTIETTFRTNQQRGLLGMSFGGLFTAHVMLNQPEMFTHYLIADATFVWDENYLNRTLNNSLVKLTSASLDVFLGLANNDHLGELGMTNRRWGSDFVQGLKGIDNDQLRVSSRYFADEKHGTVTYLAFYFGLIELFGQSEHP